MRRGDVVLVAAPGDFGKVRPAVVVQSDLLNARHGSVVVCLMTSDEADAPDFRVAIEPTPTTGLRKRSFVTVDKIMTFRVERIRGRIGTIPAAILGEIDARLVVILGVT